EGRNGRVHDVDGVVAAERLRQDVMDTGALQHGARRATGDHTGTGRSRTQHDHTGRRLTLDRVGDGRADHRNAEEALTRFLDALLDGRGNFLGLAVADTDQAVAVAHDHQGGEAEAPATLDDLGDTVDRYDALELILLGRIVATVTAAVAAPAIVAAARGGVGVLSGGSVSAVTPLTSRHQTFLPFTLVCAVVLIIRTSTRLPGRRRRAPRSGRGSRGHRGRTPRPPHRRPWHAR